MTRIIMGESLYLDAEVNADDLIKNLSASAGAGIKWLRVNTSTGIARVNIDQIRMILEIPEQGGEENGQIEGNS